LRILSKIASSAGALQKYGGTVCASIADSCYPVEVLLPHLIQGCGQFLHAWRLWRVDAGE
jgi:hypothetical protein